MCVCACACMRVCVLHACVCMCICMFICGHQQKRTIMNWWLPGQTGNTHTFTYRHHMVSYKLPKHKNHSKQWSASKTCSFIVKTHNLDSINLFIYSMLTCEPFTDHLTYCVSLYFNTYTHNAWHFSLNTQLVGGKAKKELLHPTKLNKEYNHKTLLK